MMDFYEFSCWCAIVAVFWMGVLIVAYGCVLGFYLLKATITELVEKFIEWRG